MTTPSVLLYDDGEWILFEKPKFIIQTDNIQDVIPCLNKLQTTLDNGFYAAGFLTYESSPAFEPEIPVHKSQLPLLWFGIFDRPQHVSISENKKHNPPLFNWTPTVSEETYYQKISSIKEYIRNGDTYQVNYTFDLKSSFKDDTFDFFKYVVTNHPSPYSAYVDIGSHVFCCFSPELFFSRKGSSLLCRPMKGTIPRGKTNDEDERKRSELLNSTKNRAENVMVVDMIRNDLGKISQNSSVNVTKLFEIEKYRTVFQMTSTVKSVIECSIPEIFKALFPCASITGAPKIRTAQIIHELEGRPRGIYCGTIGYAGPDLNAKFNVAIRTVTFCHSDSSALYSTGSGIVWDSQWKDEFNECLTKSKVVFGDYEDFQLIESLLHTPEEGYFLFNEHINRCISSSKYFGFKVKEESFIQYLLNLKQSLPIYPVKIRCIVNKNGNFESSFAPVSLTDEPVSISIASTPIHSSNIYLYHKTTRRKTYNDALQSCPGNTDVILWNESGQITETISGNLILSKNGKLLTPTVSCGLLAGTFRNNLLKKMEIEEAELTIDDLFNCDEIFKINSVRKWQKCIINISKKELCNNICSQGLNKTPECFSSL